MSLRVIRSISLSVLCCATMMVAVPSSAQSGDPHPHGDPQHGKADDHGHGEHGHGKHLDGPGFHHDFSDVDRWSKRFDSPERPGWQKPETVVALMGVEPGMAVADLGAGTGFFLSYLSEAAGADGKVWGLDVEQSLVDHMNQRAEHSGWANVEARKIPYDSPGLEPGSVDRILIVNTWHHIDARASYSAELLKALKDDGSVWVVDYTLESDEGPPKAHRLAPERVIRELEQGGFQASVVEEDLGRQYVVKGEKVGDAD